MGNKLDSNPIYFPIRISFCKNYYNLVKNWCTTFFYHRIQNEGSDHMLSRPNFLTHDTCFMPKSPHLQSEGNTIEAENYM